jgi:hypothetical protein
LLVACIFWEPYLVICWRDNDDDVCFVLDQHAELDFYSPNLLKQQPTGKTCHSPPYSPSLLKQQPTGKTCHSTPYSPILLKQQPTGKTCHSTPYSPNLLKQQPTGKTCHSTRTHYSDSEPTNLWFYSLMLSA